MKSDSYFRACLLVLLTVVGLQVAFSACGSSPEAAEPVVEDEFGDVEYERSSEAPVVLGTVIEASTGALLAGAKIIGPGGQLTTTDAEGCFELRGLVAGSKGMIRATTEAGLQGENQLRTILAGQLEVVIYLR